MLNSCTVNWKATLQSVVALSTTEAKYTTATEAVKEALWLKELVTKLMLNKKLIHVHCDNLSAIHLCKNSECLEKTKHIDIKFTSLEMKC